MAHFPFGLSFWIARSSGRQFFWSRTVLRFQDAAIQILGELLPAAFYRRSSTSAYFSTRPPEFRRNQFPDWMLAAALTNKTSWTSISGNAGRWTIRRCDAAAGAIQRITKKDFGYNEEGTEEEKDKAIDGIQDWLSQKHQKPGEAQQ